MLRKSGLIWSAWAAPLFLLIGCDLFSTREIVSKPADIQSLQGLGKKDDSLAFRVTESLRDPGSKIDRQVISKKRLVFLSLGDSVVDGDTLKSVALRVTSEASGAVLEQSVRLLHFTGDGLFLSG